MEKYDLPNHLFYDGYKLNRETIIDEEYINVFLQIVNRTIFNDEGKITMIPYFNGKVKQDGGVSGVIIGDGFHFTCHTFAYKDTVFIDYYGDDHKKKLLLKLINDSFRTDDYDLGSKEVHGNFGKHIIIKAKPIKFDEAVSKVKQILKDIEMTPINDLIINRIDDDNFDILQPIAESHISFHEHSGSLNIDVFSCKYFDPDKLLSLIGDYDENFEVNRGIKYV